MKKNLLLIVVALTMTFYAQTQVYKTINVISAGSLGSLLNSTEKSTVTDLKITGNIDARDFVCLRDTMSALSVLDISAASIQTYTGSAGTNSTSITYPANEIPQYSFYNISSIGTKLLNTIILPNNITSIGDYAFEFCSNLTNLVIPNSVSSIGLFSFNYCSGLVSVSLSNKLNTLGSEAFANCTKLQSIVLPATLGDLGSMAFYGCNSMTSFTVDPANQYYSSTDGVLFSKDQITLIQYPSKKAGTSYSVPNSVRVIDDISFRYCIYLTSIVMPKVLIGMGDRSFENCTALKSIEIPDKIAYIGDYAFYFCTSLTSVTIPNSIVIIGRDVFGWCSKLASVNFGNTIASIGINAFERCTALKTVTIQNVTPPSLESSSFLGVSSVTDVFVPTDAAVTAYKADSKWIALFPGNIIKKAATVLTDYSTTKYAIIGSGYFINNMLNGTKAGWNTCWADLANNVQPSTPVVSGSGKIFTWSFPNVLMFGGLSSGDGMFKFCIPNSDNTPNWAIEPIGYVKTNFYTGSAVADVDIKTDGGGAFTILTSGITRKYNLKLIIDQTSGADQITLDINSVNTAVSEINLADANIVSYKIYNELGALLINTVSTSGMKLRNIKETLNKGLYIINAKLDSGQNQTFKIIIP